MSIPRKDLSNFKDADISKRSNGILSQQLCVLYLFSNLFELPVSLVVGENSNSYSKNKKKKKEFPLIL